MRDIILKQLTSKLWELQEDYTFEGYDVPKGFRSDGLSIPRFARWFVDPLGKGLPAGLVHDHMLTEEGGYLDNRKEADDKFYENLRRCGFSRLRAGICWMGVRLGSLCPFLRPKH